MVTAKSEGEAMIIATSRYNPAWTASFLVKVSNVPNGRYYFANNETLRIMDIKDGSSNSGALIHQWDFYGKDSQEWIVELQQDGYYTIKSYLSSLYLSVEGNSSNEDTKIIQTSGGTESGQRWKFERLDTDSYKIKAQCGTNNDMCLAVGGYIFNNNGVEIKYKKYNNPGNKQDEWTLLKIETARPVAVEGQKKSNWCWAASSRMFAKNYYYDNVSRTQNQAVQYIKGREVNEGGTVVEAKDAMQYYISNISGASYSLYHGIYKTYSEETLRRFLDDGHVIYIGRSEYTDIRDPNSATAIGHSMLIYGYVKDDNGYRFLIRDPSPVNQGSSYYISYQKIYNGRNNKPWEDFDRYIWDAFAVHETSYMNNTVNYYFG